MKKNREFTGANWLLPGVIIIGLAARFFLVTFGHNYDLDSDTIVAEIVDQGGNVYADTTRYNYAPVWFNVLYVLNQLAGHDQNVFHFLLTGFLSLVDVGIFLVLWRTFGKIAACLFFLNPVSIIITGFHCQFDNLAVLLGLWGAKLMGEEFDQPVNRRKLAGLLVLGLSLMTKHLLFAFPFWLAVKQKGLWQKCVVILVPATCFLLSFAPYWHEGRQGIIDNVFLYRSYQNQYFYRYFIPMGIQFFCSSQIIWCLLLGLFAFICRKKNAVESLLFYTAVLVAASPAMANQYLAIPAAFVSVYVNPFTVLYTLASTWHLSINFSGPHFFKNIYGKYDDISVFMLSFALIWITWRQNLVSFIKKCREEIKIQLDP